MRITNEQLQQILADMHPIAWTELGRMHIRQPLGVAISGRAAPTLVYLGLAEPIGRQNLEHGITALGELVWDHHRPAAYHRRRR